MIATKLQDEGSTGCGLVSSEMNPYFQFLLFFFAPRSCNASTQVRTSVYNAAITACGHAGSAEDAIPLLEEMRARSVPRSVITYR